MVFWTYCDLELKNLKGMVLLGEIHTQSRSSDETQAMIVVFNRSPRSTDEGYHAADQERLGIVEADEANASRHNGK